MSIEQTEGILYDYIIQILPLEEIKEIHNGDDIINSLSSDAEEDIKERVWELIKEELNYKSIVEAVKDWLRNNTNTSEDDSEEEEEDEDSEENTTDSD